MIVQKLFITSTLSRVIITLYPDFCSLICETENKSLDKIQARKNCGSLPVSHKKPLLNKVRFHKS
jgi:hypothetical protein